MASLLVAAGAEGPSRVVSLAPSLTEIVFALGAGDRLVGATSYCDYPEAARSIDRVGTFLQPNVEVILGKRPDLVLAVPSPENRKSVEALRELGLEVRVVRPDGVAGALEAIRTIAAELQVEERGSALVRRIQSDLAEIEGKVAGTERKRVLMVVGRRPLIAAGDGTYQDELIERAGGANVAADTGKAWPHLSMERVIALAPEVIIDAGMTARESSGSEAFWKSFPTIPAVRDGRVFGSGRYDLLRPGPRVAETLETIAGYVHPERMATADERR